MSASFRPGSVELFPTRPNPFRTATTIEFALPSRGPATILVYDATGRRVRRLVHGEQPAGIRTVTWDGRNDAGLRVSAGVYFLRLETVQTTRLRKVVLTR